MGAFSCFHPVVIRDSRGTRTVPCGHCPACLNRKASILSNQCNIEAQHHKFNYFVTLTYADSYLPLCKVVKSDGLINFVDVSSRDCLGNLGIDGTRLMYSCRSTDFDDNYFTEYYSKLRLHSDYHGFIPYLSRRDLQLFLKRVRKQLSTLIPDQDDAQIRYYACGEYGPVHFRPHYHLILSSNSRDVSRVLRKVVLSCWRFGIVDIQTAKDGAAGYCSRYINSLSHLSAVQRLSCFRPFTAHSTHFAASFYQVTSETLKQDTYTDYLGRSITVRGKSVEVFPWLAFENNLYPKCYGYGSSDSFCRLFLYQSYRQLSEELGSDKCSVLAERLYNLFFYQKKSCSWLNEFLTIFDGYYDKRSLKSTFLSLLYTSKKFLRLCFKYNYSPSDYLRIIENYYNSKDYYCLINNLSDMQIISQQSDFDPLSLLSFYCNYSVPSVHQRMVFDAAVDDLKYRFEHDPFCDRLSVLKEYCKLTSDSPYIIDNLLSSYLETLGIDPLFFDDKSFSLYDYSFYRLWRNGQQRIYNSSVKHKKLQDTNLIYCYGKYYDPNQCAQSCAS